MWVDGSMSLQDFTTFRHRTEGFFLRPRISGCFFNRTKSNSSIQWIFQIIFLMSSYTITILTHQMLMLGHIIGHHAFNSVECGLFTHPNVEWNFPNHHSLYTDCSNWIPLGNPNVPGVFYTNPLGGTPDLVSGWLRGFLTIFMGI